MNARDNDKTIPKYVMTNKLRFISTFTAAIRESKLKRNKRYHGNSPVCVLVQTN